MRKIILEFKKNIKKLRKCEKINMDLKIELERLLFLLTNLMDDQIELDGFNLESQRMFLEGAKKKKIEKKIIEKVLMSFELQNAIREISSSDPYIDWEKTKTLLKLEARTTIKHAIEKLADMLEDFCNSFGDGHEE